MFPNKLLYIYLVLIYTSCKNETTVTERKYITDSIILSEGVGTKDTIIQDTAKSIHNKEVPTINSRTVFDPKKEPSSVIPKNPVPHQMPLPGGVPDKHYIDSIKNARGVK